MQKYQDVVLNQNGNPIAGAEITVTDLLGTPVPVYASNGIGLNVNPVSSDADGRFFFYAPDGRYNLVVRFGGNIMATVTDILLEDPQDGSDAVFNDVTVLGELSDAGKIVYNPSGTGAVATDVQSKLREFVSVRDFGAVGDGVTDDTLAIQRALDFAGSGGRVLFPQTTANTYITSSALKFYSGQTWIGSGGTDILRGLGTEIRLTAASTSVAEPNTPDSITFGFNPIGIYFNAQGHADAALSLYNTSYAAVDQCAANVTKAGAAAVLLDSNVSLQCYFNNIIGGRWFANGVGSVCIRFTRGANSNYVLGGKCGSSTRGMEFLSLSAGNVVYGTNFEENTDRHVYIDSPSNTFVGVRMENSPIGFDITANGTATSRIGISYATSTAINVQDASKTGSVVDTRRESAQTTGDLRFGPAKFDATYTSGGSTLRYDPDLISGTSNAIVDLFRFTTTTGARQLNIFKGDGTGARTFSVDADTGTVIHGDIVQENGAAGGVYRSFLRRAGTPATAASAGDTIKRTNPSTTAVVTEWTCVAAGTPGTYQASGWVVTSGATASRPTLSSVDHGVMYFDTTLAAAGRPIWWTGTAWVDATAGGDVLVTGSLGYGTGAGGTVTQATSKSTAVTLNRPTGQITLSNEALAANTTVSFNFNNSLVTANDAIAVSFNSPNYNVWVGCTAGVAVVYVRNISGASLSEALVINFTLLKGAIS